MLSVIPGSQSLSELASLIEFLRIVSTTDGLQETLTRIAEAQQEIDKGLARNANTEAELAERHKESLRVQAVAQENLSVANSRLVEAQAKEANVNERLVVVEQKEADLARREQEFLAFKKDVEGKLKVRAQELDARAAALSEAETAAETIRAEYQAKVESLRKAVG